MTSWTTEVCKTDGVDIHYLRTGGAKPPVVLLHGLTASGACWTPLARSLEADFDVLMPDARGHGKSSTPSHGYRYEDHANDVGGLIRGLGLAAPVLVGHSMGGMTAALAASQLGDAINGVILADPSFLSAEWQRFVFESDVVEQHRQLLSRTKDDLIAEARARHPDRSTEILDLIAEARLQTRTDAFAVLTPPNPDYHDLVSAIRVPILLVMGDVSLGAVVSPEAASELQTLNRRLTVEQIPNAGHGLPYDQPEHLAALVRSFLLSMAAH